MLNTSINYLTCEVSLLRKRSEHRDSSAVHAAFEEDEHDRRRQLIEDAACSSFDGELIWKITDVNRKFEEAKSGKKVLIESPALFSSPTGYKMRACLYPNGDEDAHGMHMSLSIRILKNHNDALLTWPYNFPVEFCLFDQTGKGRHIIDKFYPDTTTSNFLRPTSEKNLPSGISKFCPLAIITQSGNPYIDRDTMFIKVKLDFDNAPREILPYTSALNPGLPTCVAHAYRRMYIEQFTNAREAILEEMNRNNQDILRRGLVPDNATPFERFTQEQIILERSSSHTALDQ